MEIIEGVKFHTDQPPPWGSIISYDDLTSYYQLLYPIGQGSLGIVYSGIDMATRYPVAIKVATTDIADLRREADLLQSLHHPNIIRVLAYFETPNRGYLVMERMATDLNTLMENRNDISIGSVLRQLLSALNYIHTHNIVHCDIKPENILFDAQGVLKLCDFNLSVDLTINNPQPIVQTRYYRAPEVILRSQPYTTAIDLWSVGCLLGELLHYSQGKRAVLFQGEHELHQMVLIVRQLGSPPDDLVDLWEQHYIYRGIAIKFGYQHQKSWFRKFPRTVSRDALDLLNRMLIYHPPARITAGTALHHDWLKN